MTKLKLKFATSDEILSREEMKQVFGGYMSGSGETGSSTCYWFRCQCSSPNSIVIVGSTKSAYVNGNSLDEVKKEAKKECAGYNKIDCVKDKPC